MLEARFLGDQRVRGKKSRVAVLKDLSLGLLSRYYQLMILMSSVSETLADISEFARPSVLAYHCFRVSVVEI